MNTAQAYKSEGSRVINNYPEEELSFMSIGIIGFGRFGRLAVKYLSADFEVFVSSRSASPDDVESLGGALDTLESICAQDFVIPTVPISAFEGTIRTIAPILADNLVIDACSVKEYPVEVMKTHLPDHVQILATHPMFGPDSALNTLTGQKIVLSRIRIEDQQYDRIKKYLQGKGLIVIETSPENHDRQIAQSQVLTHFIGRGLSELGASDVEIDTEGYKRLMKILDVVGHDTRQLFTDLNRYNEYAREIRQSFIKALINIDSELG